MTCKTCGTPLEQPQTGRKRVYCSSACKKRSSRLKAKLRHRFGPVSGTVSGTKAAFRPAARDVSAPALEPLVDVDGPHITRTYESFEQYAAARSGGFVQPARDYQAEAALALERASTSPRP